MATTQLDCSVGFSVAETTYGTAVTVTKFPEFTEETFDWDPTFVQGVGMRVGSRVARSARRGTSPAKQQVTGDMTVEAGSKGLGLFFSAALGTVVSTQRGSTGVYQHNFTPAASDYLSSYTIQKGTPPLGGGSTVAHTFPGAVCSGFELDCPNGDLVTLKSSWVGREVLTATAYAAPSYATPVELFNFSEGAITIAGSVTAATTTVTAFGGTAVADIRDINVTWDNGLDDGGYNLGSGGKRARRPAIGMSTVSGSMTAEFDATTLRDAYTAQTDLALVLTFTGTSTIGSGSDNPVLQVHIPNIRLEGELPKSAAGSVVTQSIDFTGLSNLSLSPIIVSYVSTDVTP